MFVTKRKSEARVQEVFLQQHKEYRISRAMMEFTDSAMGDDSTMLTTLLDPLEQSIFRDSGDEDSECDETLMLEDGIKAQILGVEENVERIDERMNALLTRKEDVPSTSVECFYVDDVNKENNPGARYANKLFSEELKKSMRIPLSDKKEIKSRKKTPLRDIGNLSVSGTEDGDKLPNKFTELGSRIRMLLEESMTVDIVKDCDKIVEENVTAQVITVSEDKIVPILSTSTPSKYDSPTDEEVALIISRAAEETNRKHHSRVRSVNPVAKILFGDSASPEIPDFALSKKTKSSTCARPEPCVARPPSASDHVAGVQNDMKLTNNAAQLGKGDVFRPQKVGVSTEITVTENEVDHDSLCDLEIRGHKIATPTTTSTAMILWDSSPELLFSPGNCNLDAQSLEQLRKKFQLRTERRRRRREAMRRMLATPHYLNKYRVKPRALDQALECSDDGVNARSKVCTTRSTSGSATNDATDALKTVVLDSTSQTSSLSSTSHTESDVMSRNTESEVDTNSWRDVIKRSKETVRKLDNLFGQSEDVASEDAKLVANMAPPEPFVSSTTRSMGDSDRKRSSKWWDSDTVSETFSNKNDREDAGRSASVLDFVFGTSSPRKQRMPVKRNNVRSKNVTTTTTNARPILRGLLERIHSLSTGKSTSTNSSYASITKHRATASRESTRSANSSVRVCSPIGKSEGNTASASQSPSDAKAVVETHMLDVISNELIFHAYDARGMCDSGRREVVPFEIRSMCTTEVLLVKLRIQMRQNLPLAVRSELENFQFSFAIEDDHRMPPLTCRSNLDTGGLQNGQHFQGNAMLDHTPSCQAMELRLRPGATCRIRLSLTCRGPSRSVPACLCPAMLLVSANAVEGNGTSTSRFVTKSVPLFLRAPIHLLTNDTMSCQRDPRRRRFDVSVRIAAYASLFASACSCVPSSPTWTSISSERASTDVFLGESESGQWMWRVVEVMNRDPKRHAVAFVSFESPNSSKASTCRWSLRRDENEGHANVRGDELGPMRQSGCVISKPMSFSLRPSERRTFALGTCAVNRPRAYSLDGRRSYHHANLIVRCETSNATTKEMRTFKMKLCLHTRGSIRLQVPRLIAGNDSALSLRCALGGSVERILPVRNTGSVPFTARLSVVGVNETQMPSSSRIFTVWPSQVRLLPGEACACTIRFSAVDGAFTSRVKEGSSVILVSTVRIAVPGASYSIPVRAVCFVDGNY